jgi:thiol:disulfide interchange protein DsbD
MKKLFFLAVLFFSVTALFAQENPVHWKYRVEKIGNMEYNIIAEADIQDGWYMYSQYLESNDGPVPTSFDFSKNKTIALIGKNEESGNIKKVFDKVFDMNVIKFAHKAIFTQKIKLATATNSIVGSIEYMCCDEGMCLPPKRVPFEISL